MERNGEIILRIFIYSILKIKKYKALAKKRLPFKIIKWH